MAAWQIFKVSRKTFFNPSAWINLDGIKDSTMTIWDIVHGITTPEAPVREESFEAALKRNKISDAAAQQTGRVYLSYAIILAICGIACLLFSFYLLIFHTVSGWIIGMAASALFLGQAFRFHFWYFQIKHRTLGCTFAEWRSGKVNKRARP